MIKETYFAIRIGSPKFHTPYLLLNIKPGGPALFDSMVKAKEMVQARVTTRYCKIVKVEVRELPSRKAASGKRR